MSNFQKDTDRQLCYASSRFHFMHVLGTEHEEDNNVWKLMLKASLLPLYPMLPSLTCQFSFKKNVCPSNLFNKETCNWDLFFLSIVGWILNNNDNNNNSYGCYLTRKSIKIAIFVSSTIPYYKISFLNSCLKKQ